jgi:hypothetical protein
MKRDFYFSKARMVVLLTLVVMLMIGFIAAVVLMLSNPADNAMAIFFCGGVILLLVWSTFLMVKNFSRKEANVTVSDDGLTLRGTAGPGFMPWEDIEGVIPYKAHNNDLLGILLKNEEKYLDSLSKGGKRLARLNLKTGFPAFNIGLSNIKEKQELIDLLVQMNVPFFVESHGKEPLETNPPKDTHL